MQAPASNRVEQERRRVLLLAYAAKPAPAEGTDEGPLKGRESEMSMKPEQPASHLQILRALLTRSPIHVLPAPQPRAVFADWERERKSPDIDARILTWIASHVPAAQRNRLH